MFKPLICTALVLASGFALAQDPGAGRGDRAERHAQWQAKAEARFSAADKNADGRIDKTEASAVGERMARNFDRMDANADGFLDKAELMATRQKMRRAGGRMKTAMAYQRGLFVGMDDDGDGALTRAEMGTKHKPWSDDFDIIDTNADGKATAEELRAYGRAKLQARRAEREG